MNGEAMPSIDGRSLILRGDASARIGTGHLMRMLALAQAWRDAGGRAELIVAEAPDGILDRYAREEVTIRRTPSPHPNPDDVAAVVARLRADPMARIVIDGPTFDGAYLDALGDSARRALVIDDMATLGRYPVGLVLNQNAHADRSDYPADDGPVFLLGLQYTLLRREFRTPRPPRSVPTRARHILATFGGTDQAGMMPRTLRAIARTPAHIRDSLTVTAVIGSATPAAAEAAAAAAGAGLALTVERDVTDMISRMNSADLTVTSGGTTVWELARTGAPSLVIETAPTEHDLARGLDRVGLFDRLGPAAHLNDSTLTAVIARRIDDFSTLR